MDIENNDEQMDTNPFSEIDVGRLTQMYQSSSKSFNLNEREQLQDRLYVTDSSYQLSPRELAELRKRRMSPLTMNWCEKLKRSLVGIIESNPVDPIAIPQNEDSEDGAEIATKLIRYNLDKNNWSTVRLDVASDFFVEGVCASIIEVEEFTNRRTGEVKYRPMIRRVSPYDFFYDPTSKERDFKDCSYLGIRKWISEGELESLYPERFAEIGSPLGDNTFASTFDFQDTTAIEMVDRQNKKIALIEMYELKNGDWQRTVFAANGVYDFDEALFTDTWGNSFCPITAVSNIVDIRHNTRIGSIRRVRSSQDVINQIMIKVAAAINSRQIQQTGDQSVTTASIDAVRKEASRVDGIIPTGYSLIPNTDSVEGNMEILQQQVQFMMDAIPNASVQQTIQANNASGRSKLVDQELGLIEYAEMLKNIASFEETVYKKIWYAMTEYCTSDEIINVSGDPRAPEYIHINHVIGFQQVPQMNPETQQVELVNQPVMENSLIEMEVDIRFRQTPRSPALEGEVFDSFVQLIQNGVQVNTPEFEILLDLAPIEDKLDLREKIEKWYGKAQPYNEQVAAQQAQQAAQAQAQQQQLQQLQTQYQIEEGKLNLARLEAQIEQIRSTTMKNLASVNETDADLQTQANTESIQIQKDSAEAELKTAKAAALNYDTEHALQDRGMMLRGINPNTLLNN